MLPTYTISNISQIRRSRHANQNVSSRLRFGVHSPNGTEVLRHVIGHVEYVAHVLLSNSNFAPLAFARRSRRLGSQWQIEPDIVIGDARGEGAIGALFEADQAIVLHRFQGARKVGLRAPGSLGKVLK